MFKNCVSLHGDITGNYGRNAAQNALQKILKKKPKQPHMFLQWILLFCDKNRWTKADGTVPSTGCIMQWSLLQVEKTLFWMILGCIITCHAWNERVCWYLSVEPCFPSVLTILICPSSQRWPGNFRESCYRLFSAYCSLPHMLTCSILLYLTIPSASLK